MLSFTQLATCFLLVLAATSCESKKAADTIRVEGFVENLPNGKAYLTDAYDWKIVIDSAVATNGHFRVEITPDTAFVPFLASIHYPDSTQKAWHYIKRLVYLNTYETTGNITSGTSSFFLGPEGAVITEDKKSATAPLLAIRAGKDNDLFQQLAGKGFGYISTRDPANRPGRLRYFQGLIKQNPTSYFLLESILNDKANYTEQELEGLLALFQQQVRESRVGRALRTYLANRTDAHTPYRNLVLADASQVPRGILDPKARLNLLIFWASWCGPCRQEIPALKQVYRAFHGRGLHMASISIDEVPRKWQQALGEEQMGWHQFILPESQALRVKQQFNLSGVPLVILTDSVGNEIMQKTGAGERNMAALNEAIALRLR